MGSWLTATVAATAVLASPAAAAIKSATFTAPASGTEYFYDTDTGAGSIEVHGTVSNATAGAKGDLLCYPPGHSPLVLASGIDVSTGSFAFNASLKAAATQVCQLALVPAARPRAATPPRRSRGRRSALPEASRTRGPASCTATTSSAARLLSPMRSAPRANAPSSPPTRPTLDAAELLAVRPRCVPAAGRCRPHPGPTRSALQIDGQNAYLPGAVGPTFDSRGKATARPDRPAGLPAPPYTATFDAAHQTVTIDDTEPAMIRDPPATDPPDPATCPSLHDSGGPE